VKFCFRICHCFKGKEDINRFDEYINRFLQDINRFGEYINRFLQDINRFGEYINRFLQDINRSSQNITNPNIPLYQLPLPSEKSLPAPKRVEGIFHFKSFIVLRRVGFYKIPSVNPNCFLQDPQP
jgi:hypothetical protein